MRKLFCLLLFLSVLLMTFCSEPRREEIVADAEQESALPSSPRDQALAGAEAPLVIIGADYHPLQPHGHQDIQLRPKIKGSASDLISYDFRWFVNNLEVEGDHGDTLSAEFFRKNDWVHCLVQARSGDQQSAWFKSDLLRILNSTPSVEPLLPVNFSLPGTFSYQIKAWDDDEEEISFVLLAPLDMGIVLDPRSGLLSWQITPAMLPQLEDETVAIRFEVSDEDGAVHQAELLVHFRSRE